MHTHTSLGGVTDTFGISKAAFPLVFSIAYPVSNAAPSLINTHTHAHTTHTPVSATIDCGGINYSPFLASLCQQELAGSVFK